MRIISRSQWGARPPREDRDTTWSKRRGFTVHHSSGPKTQSIQVIQDFHMDDRKWWDIGYNFLVRHDGTVYEGRGWRGVGAHAGGHNTANIGVCVIGNYHSAEPSAAAKGALAYLYAEANRIKGATLEVNTHRQLNSTACPGDKLHAWAISRLAGYRAGTPTKPRPATPGAGQRPVPGPYYAFPLPAGHYFGPKDGGDQSVSGFYGREFAGLPDREWLKRFTWQLERRGWDARKGGTYLTEWGHDGRYGPEIAALTKKFQRDQGLNPDGLIGPLTWKAAFKNPVT
jgi:hypothetical protein